MMTKETSSASDGETYEGVLFCFLIYYLLFIYLLNCLGLYCSILMLLMLPLANWRSVWNLRGEESLSSLRTLTDSTTWLDPRMSLSCTVGGCGLVGWGVGVN